MAEIAADRTLIRVKLRALLAEVWGSKGGGFYGVGYVCAFLYFEFSMLVDDLVEAQGLDDFVVGQLLETLLRLGWLSFINVFQALFWPLMVAGWWDGWGLLLLVGSYVAFQYLLKPGLDGLFPELADYRQQKAQMKLDQAQQKAESRASRKSKRWQKKQRHKIQRHKNQP